MSAFQNQQPLNPVSPMISQHIAEGDKAAAREKDRNESARQANMQDATTRQMTREQIMARQQGFADKQASDERMQRNAQEFSAIQSSQDREFQESLAKRNLILEQKKQEANLAAAKATGEERERYETEADRLQRELIDNGVADARARMGLKRGENDITDKAGQMAESIDNRADNLAEIVEQSIEDATILPGELDIALQQAFRNQMGDLSEQSQNHIINMIARNGGPPVGDDFSEVMASFTINGSLFLDRGLNAILDGLGIPYQSVPESVRADLAGVGGPGSLGVGFAEEILGNRIADGFMDLTSAPSNPGTEQNTTDGTRRANFRGLVTQVLTGDFDELDLRGELNRLSIDHETFGTYMFHQGKTLSSAAYEARSGIEQGENFETESKIPQVLIDGARRLNVVGAKFRGMTPEDMRYMRDRLTDPDQLFTLATSRAVGGEDGAFFRRDDSDQYANEFASDLAKIVEDTRQMEFGELDRLERDAELERQIEEIERRGERKANQAGLEAGQIDFLDPRLFER